MGRVRARRRHPACTVRWSFQLAGHTGRRLQAQMSIKSLTHCGGALNQGRLVAHREMMLFCCEAHPVVVLPCALLPITAYCRAFGGRWLFRAGTAGGLETKADDPSAGLGADGEASESDPVPQSTSTSAGPHLETVSTDVVLRAAT